MDNYTMTFYCRDCLVVPPDPRMRVREVQTQVLNKMTQHKLELVDFNLTQNYQISPGYHDRGAGYKTMVEIRLDLNRADLRSREAIYNRCLNALLHGDLYLTDFIDETPSGGKPYHIFVFDKKSQAQAS